MQYSGDKKQNTQIDIISGKNMPKVIRVTCTVIWRINLLPYVAGVNTVRKRGAPLPGNDKKIEEIITLM